MRRPLLIALIILLIAALAAFIVLRNRPTAVLPQGSGTMKITSTAFAYEELIPAKYTCDGAGVNPPLAFSGLPAGAKSVALVVDDPDAPVGIFVHWVIWNIPVSGETLSIAEDSVPAGAVQGMNGARKPGYAAPCPPTGTHRYFFKAYALDAMLDAPATTDAAGLEAQMEEHILDKAGLIGQYRRP